MGFQEVFVGDECFKFPNPFKRDREWFRDFVVLNQKKSDSLEEDDEEVKNDNGEYKMIRNIGYLFDGMGDFNYNNEEDLFELWNKQETKIKKRTEIINTCLDVYDIIFPYTIRKPILSKSDLKLVHKLMDKLLYGCSYQIMDECGVDLNMEIGSPGWLELKNVLLRFFSKINFDRKFEIFEEEVEGTGHIRPLHRKDGSSLEGRISISFSKEDEEEDEEEMGDFTNKNNIT